MLAIASFMKVLKNPSGGTTKHSLAIINPRKLDLSGINYAVFLYSSFKITE